MSGLKSPPTVARVLIFFFLSFALLSCSEGKKKVEPWAQSGAQPKIVATTNIVGDLIQNLIPKSYSVKVLMGPGVDPHLYRAKPSDLEALQKADLIFYSGLKLEGTMAEILEKLAKKQPGRVFAVAESLPSSRLLPVSARAKNEYDPHVWFDVKLWGLSIEPVSAVLATYLPKEKDEIRERSQTLQNRYQELEAWIQQSVQKLPKSQRVLVTSHDAFRYFGRAYGFEVVALQGVSTSAEAGLGDMARVKDLVLSKNLKAVFVENSVSPKAIERLSRDTGVKIGAELYSDALGLSDEVRDAEHVGRYEGMIRYNVKKILEGLGA